MSNTTYALHVVSWSTTGDDSEVYPASANAGILCNTTLAWTAVPGVRRYTRQGGYPIDTGIHMWWQFGVVLARDPAKHGADDAGDWSMRIRDTTNSVTVATVSATSSQTSNLHQHSYYGYSFYWDVGYSVADVGDATWVLQYYLLTKKIHFHSAQFHLIHRPA